MGRRETLKQLPPRARMPMDVGNDTLGWPTVWSLGASHQLKDKLGLKDRWDQESERAFMMTALRRKILELLRVGTTLCLVVCATVALPRPVAQEKIQSERESGAVRVQM